MWDGIISIVALAVTGALCTWGVFSGAYDDTLLQRVGMSCLALWCWARLPIKLETLETEPVHLVLHVGLAVYAVGTALKLRKLERERLRSLMP